MNLKIEKDVPVKSLPIYTIPLAVLLAVENGQEILLSHFYQLYFDMGKQELHFDNPKVWLNNIDRKLFRHGSFRYDSKRLINIDVGQIAIAAMKNGCHVYTFSESKTGTSSFWKLLYGYNESTKVFSVLDYDDEIGLQCFEMPFEDLNKQRNMFSVGMLKLHQDISIPDITCAEIRNSLSQYINGESDNGKAVGISAIMVLDKMIDDAISEKSAIALLSFLTLREHKGIILHMLGFLLKENEISPIVYDEYRSVCKSAEETYALCKEYNQSLDNNLLIRAKAKLSEMIKVEKELLKETVCDTCGGVSD